MTEKSKHCVDAAINYANGREHGGAGYTLTVVLKNGEVIEGAYVPLDEYPDTLYLQVHTGLEAKDEVFIDKHEIVKATICW
jgi:hypothetical protein